MKPQYKLGMITSYAGFIISTLAGFILPPLIIAHLGSELNGLYNALTGFSVYFGMMDLGLGTAIIRYVAKYRTESQTEKISKYLYVMRNVYIVICGFTMLAGGIVTLFVPHIFRNSIPDGYEVKAQLVFLFSILSIVLTIFDNLYYSAIKAYEQFFISRTSAIARVLLRVVLIVILLEMRFSIIAVSFADFFATLLVLLYRMIYTKKRLGIFYQKPQKGEIQLREVFGYSAYVIIYSLVEKVFWQLDKVVLGIMSGGVSVTIYTIGSQISSSISSVSSTVSSMYLPHAVKTSSRREKYTQVMAQMARYQLFVILPVFLGFIFFGKDFLLLWVGKGYNESYKIAVVLIATLIPVLLQSYGEALLKAMNIQKVYAGAMVVSVILNIGFTVILIPGYGAYGAALASAVVNVIRCMFMALYFQKTLNIGIIGFTKTAFQGLAIVIGISVATGMILSRFIHASGWFGLIVKVSLFAIAYGVSVYFISLNEHESAMMKKYLRKFTHRKA